MNTPDTPFYSQESQEPQHEFPEAELPEVELPEVELSKEELKEELSSVLPDEELPSQTESHTTPIPVPDSSSSSESSHPPSSPSSSKSEEPKKNPEEILTQTIALMESSLALDGNADFRRFWEAREQCLPLFKENISPPVRAELWEKYRELTKQARLLKEHFEKESSFAIEQIEIAISALEKEIAEVAQMAEQVSFEKDFLDTATLKANREQYCKIQRELTLLNAHASRIGGLRKELTHTNMRMRKKGQFFQRLSVAGDLVMPRRKELIQEISELFTQDVDQFIQTHFSQKSPVKPIHQCRDEIKILQGVAKQLSINTKAFSETRTKLSACWDKLKEKEKEHKKEQAEKKELFKVNTQEIRKKIEAFNANLAAKTSSTDEMQKELDQIIKEMRDVELGRDDVKALKEEISLARKPLFERAEEDANRRRQAAREKEEKKRAEIQTFEKEIKELSSQIENLESAAIEERIVALRGKMADLSLSILEKEKFSRSFTSLEESASEKAETLSQLPDDPKSAAKALQRVLKSKKERKKGIKERIEKYRKTLGGSGLGFEQSLHYNEQIAAEKERYEKIGKEIEAVEVQITKLSC